VFALRRLRWSSKGSLVYNITPPSARDFQVIKEFLIILYHFGSGGCKGVIIKIVNSTQKVLFVVEGEVFNPKVMWEEVCHSGGCAVSLHMVFFVGRISIFKGYPGFSTANVEGEGVSSPIFEDARGWMLHYVLVPFSTPRGIPSHARRWHYL
jgi:hypothetical protein